MKFLKGYIGQAVTATVTIVATVATMSFVYGQDRSKLYENIRRIDENRKTIQALEHNLCEKLDKQKEDMREIIVAITKITTKMGIE